MKIIINDETYDFDPQSMTNIEAMALERAVGMTMGEWQKALQDGSTTALTGIVWLAMRRRDPGVKFSDVTFAFGALRVEDDEDEAPVDPTDAAEEPTPEG